MSEAMTKTEAGEVAVEPAISPEFQIELDLLNRHDRQAYYEFFRTTERKYCKSCGFLKSCGHAPDCPSVFFPQSLNTKLEETGSAEDYADWTTDTINRNRTREWIRTVTK